MSPSPMKMRPLLTLATAGLLLCAGCDSTPLLNTCRAAGGGTPFATRYLPLGPPAPAGSSCASPGQPLALSAYDIPGGERPLLAIAVSDIETYPADGGAPALAEGSFSERDADRNDLCEAPQLSPLRSGTLRYTFSDVALYVSAAAQGTQLKARLTIADTGPGACSASYQVVGLWPQVPCETDDQCGEGSGINPDLFDAVSCDTAIGACMLNGNDFVKVGGDD